MIIVGAGQRGNAYAKYALDNPDSAVVTGIAEPRNFYRNKLVSEHGTSSYVGRLQNGSAETPILTERECEVIRHFSNGKSTKEIAYHINMSGKTVDACRRKIMDKLHINSTAELVKYALKAGLSTMHY